MADIRVKLKEREKKDNHWDLAREHEYEVYGDSDYN